MRQSRGFTLVELLVVVGIIGLLAAILVPTLQQANELTNRTVCMSNLASVGKALTLYKGTNDNAWPWLHDKIKGWDKTVVSKNRDVNAFNKAEDDPNSPVERSITSMMFLLVRENQPVKLFVCPSTDDRKDDVIVDANEDKDEPEYYWDFSSYRNVSYSWQAPIKDRQGWFRQGLSDNDTDAVVICDQTPEAAVEEWENDKWDPDLTGQEVEPHNSQNHSRGKQNNCLFVAMNVAKHDRPDVGTIHDMIYTASAEKKRGSRQSTKKSIDDHHTTRDSFMIGPVGYEDANQE